MGRVDGHLSVGLGRPRKCYLPKVYRWIGHLTGQRSRNIRPVLVTATVAPVPKPSGETKLCFGSDPLLVPVGDWLVCDPFAEPVGG